MNGTGQQNSSPDPKRRKQIYAERIFSSLLEGTPTAPRAVYDFKTGNAVLTEPRISTNPEPRSRRRKRAGTADQVIPSMKKEQFELLARDLLSNREDFRFKGNLEFFFPIQSLLRGLCFEGSAFDKKAFYVSWFVLPMYVPTMHVYLNFGDRILHQGGDRWSLDNNEIIDSLRLAIHDQALPTLNTIKSIEEFIYFLKKFDDKDPYVLQASVYSLAVLERFREALAGIDQLKATLDVKIPWQAKLNDAIAKIEEIAPQALS